MELLHQEGQQLHLVEDQVLRQEETILHLEDQALLVEAAQLLQGLVALAEEVQLLREVLLHLEAHLHQEVLDLLQAEAQDRHLDHLDLAQDLAAQARDQAEVLDQVALVHLVQEEEDNLTTP